MAIRVTTTTGEKIYDTAVSFETDGYGDVILLDSNDKKIALIPRSRTPEIEVL